jgi:hypothetical protein
MIIREKINSFLEVAKPILEKYPGDVSKALEELESNENSKSKLDELDKLMSDKEFFGITEKMQTCQSQERVNELIEEFKNLPADNKELVILNVETAKMFVPISSADGLNSPLFWYNTLKNLA